MRYLLNVSICMKPGKPGVRHGTVFFVQTAPTSSFVSSCFSFLSSHFFLTSHFQHDTRLCELCNQHHAENNVWMLQYERSPSAGLFHPAVRLAGSIQGAFLGSLRGKPADINVGSKQHGNLLYTVFREKKMRVFIESFKHHANTTLS